MWNILVFSLSLLHGLSSPHIFSLQTQNSLTLFSFFFFFFLTPKAKIVIFFSFALSGIFLVLIKNFLFCWFSIKHANWNWTTKRFSSLARMRWRLPEGMWREREKEGERKRERETGRKQSISIFTGQQKKDFMFYFMFFLFSPSLSFWNCSRICLCFVC